jgi:hypothetical protein
MEFVAHSHGFLRLTVRRFGVRPSGTFFNISQWRRRQENHSGAVASRIGDYSPFLQRCRPSTDESLLNALEMAKRAVDPSGGCGAWLVEAAIARHHAKGSLSAGGRLEVARMREANGTHAQTLAVGSDS